MSTQEEILNYWLGRCYAADNLLEGKFSEIHSAFKKQLARGTQLEKEAQSRAAKLESVKDRCFISKKHLGYLQSALEAS